MIVLLVHTLIMNVLLLYLFTKILENLSFLVPWYLLKPQYYESLSSLIPARPLWQAIVTDCHAVSACALTRSGPGLHHRRPTYGSRGPRDPMTLNVRRLRTRRVGIEFRPGKTYWTRAWSCWRAIRHRCECSLYFEGLGIACSIPSK